MKLTIEQNKPLAPLTTFKTGGSADFFCTPVDLTEVQEAFGFAEQQSLPCFIMGGGSNLLIHDDGYRGLIIHTGALNRIRISGERISCGSGCRITDLTNRAAAAGLSGLEFAGGLPGTAGGALFMNARAYGGEFGSLVESVECVDRSGAVHRYSGEQLNFNYKHSLLMENSQLAVEIHLLLQPGDAAQIKAQTRENLLKRSENGQFQYPNAGCVFKNDRSIGTPSGRLIDQLGLLGTRIGDAQVFERHGNFIINRGSATSQQIADLIRQINDTVYSKTGHRLAEEIRYLGFPDCP